MAASAPDITRVLAIVPARAGSTSLPRKNMRLLGGRPLVAHTVEALDPIRATSHVVISTDDHAIRTWSELHGYAVHERSADLASDTTELSMLAASIADDHRDHDTVGVFPPTSPFRSGATVVEALRRFSGSSATSLSSCVRSDHVHWHSPTGELEHACTLPGPVPTDVGARGGVFYDNGAIYLVNAAALRRDRRLVTDNHILFEMTPDESLRVDQVSGLVEARRRVSRGSVVFRVRGDAAVGSGHTFHCLELADELADQDVAFLLKDCEPWVEDLIKRFNYTALRETDLVADLKSMRLRSPRVIVNDVLDTEERDILAERGLGFKVVNVEDLGPGARFADWVVSALYRPQGDVPHADWGARYATLRDEFHDLPPRTIRDRAARILITFGGTDPANLGARCARLLATIDHLEIHVVLGPGAADPALPASVSVTRGVPSMAQAMLDADLVLTSGGRTVYESARTGTPVVVLAQNAREATHAHLGYESGVVFLGIGALVSDGQVRDVVSRMLQDVKLRRELSARLQRSIDESGTRRVATRIRELLQDTR